MRLVVIPLVLIAAVALADKKYTGPLHPKVPADDAAIRTSNAQCVADIKEVTAWSDAETQKAADQLCDLRKKHDVARGHLLDALAKLVADFKDVTNRDHAENLPESIAGVQQLVALCEKTLATQEHAHNIEIPMQVERDAIFCDDQAAALTARLGKP